MFPMMRAPKQYDTCEVLMKVVKVDREKLYIRFFIIICLTSSLPWQHYVCLLLLTSICNPIKKSAKRYLEIKIF